MWSGPRLAFHRRPGAAFISFSKVAGSRDMYLGPLTHSSENVQSMRYSQRPQPALGKAIRQLREKQGASQVSLAKDSGITGETLSLIERGRANPTWATVRDIAAALGVSIAELAKLSEKHQ